MPACFHPTAEVVEAAQAGRTAMAVKAVMGS
jgi:hypothetical protein